MPAGCPHAVRNVGGAPTLAVSANFIDGSNRARALAELGAAAHDDPRAAALYAALAALGGAEDEAGAATPAGAATGAAAAPDATFVPWAEFKRLSPDDVARLERDDRTTDGGDANEDGGGGGEAGSAAPMAAPPSGAPARAALCLPPAKRRRPEEGERMSSRAADELHLASIFGPPSGL